MNREENGHEPDWVREFRARGFDLRFFADRTKGPSGPGATGWTDPSHPSTWYRAGANVATMTGIDLGDGRFLTDIDFDWVGGVRFAREFLPETKFGFGRASKPLGHGFYTTSFPVISKKFTDTDGTTLVERRGTTIEGVIGMLTVLPPSVHPSGEIVTFVEDGDIKHDDSVIDGTTYYAIACLLGRHWPKNGPDTNQHHTAAHAAGFLLSRGVDPLFVPRIIRVAATIGGDENVQDRVRFASDTVEKFKAGKKKLTGGPKLAQELGEDVVALLRDWLPKSSPVLSAVERLNERFAIVGVGNKVVVMETRPDGGIKALWPFQEFHRLLVKEQIRVETESSGKTTEKTVPLSEVWLKHADGRRYERLVYAMPGSAERLDANDYNGWLGFTVKPEPGDWSKNRDHLTRIICGGKPNRAT